MSNSFTSTSLLARTLTALVLSSSSCVSPDDQGAGNAPLEIVGAWYAGQGGTSAPYDPATGTFGRPNGKGLIYIFEDDGSYQKAFQSYASNGACTNGFTAYEQGTLVAEGNTLHLHPTSGHMVVEDTCVPSLDSDQPLTSLTDELFVWELQPSELDPMQTVLVLRASDGAQGTFTRL